MVNLTFATKGIDNKYAHDWGAWIQHLEERKSCCCTICAPYTPSFSSSDTVCLLLAWRIWSRSVPCKQGAPSNPSFVTEPQQRALTSLEEAAFISSKASPASGLVEFLLAQGAPTALFLLPDWNRARAELSPTEQKNKELFFFFCWDNNLEIERRTMSFFGDFSCVWCFEQ